MAGPTLNQLLNLMRRLLAQEQPPELRAELEASLGRFEEIRTKMAAGRPWVPPPEAVLTPEQAALCDVHHATPVTAAMEGIQRDEMVGEHFLTGAVSVEHPAGVFRSELKVMFATGQQAGERTWRLAVRVPAQPIPGGYRHEFFRLGVPANPQPDDVVLRLEGVTLCGVKFEQDFYPYATSQP